MTTYSADGQIDIFSMFGLEKEEETTTISLKDITNNSEEQSKGSRDEAGTNISAGFKKVIQQTETNEAIAEKNAEEKKKLSSFEDPLISQKTNKSSKSTTISTITRNKDTIGDDFKLKANTTIKYAGQEVPVSRYFSIEQIEKGLERKKKGEVITEPINEKDLIKKLNDDFAELMPQLTSLVFYSKQNIVIPVLQARTKGANIDNKESSSEEGSFSSPMRIPFRLLQDFIIIARSFSDRYGTEIHADIYYDYDQADFFMDFPKQKVHEFWATPTETAAETAFKFIERRYRKVMEIHSHHKMSPTPSTTDNQSERSPIMYAIVGHITNFFPDITVRTFNPHSECHIPLMLDQVFEYPFEKQSMNYPVDGVEVVK